MGLCPAFQEFRILKNSNSPPTIAEEQTAVNGEKSVALSLIKRALEHSLEAMTRVDDDDEFDLIGLLQVYTFQEAGIPGANPGLVIRLTDGTEYQLQMIRCQYREHQSA
jgi:hypothetical protein